MARTTAPPRKSKAAIYARISFDSEGRELGVDRQVKDCTAYARRQGWESTVFTDNSSSASRYARRRRVEFDRMVEAARAGAFDYIVVADPSRYTRAPRVVEDLIDLDEAGIVRLHSVTGGEYDLSTSSGKMRLRIEAATHAHYADFVSEKRRRQIMESVEQGVRFGGGRAFGYEKDGTTIVAGEAKILREMARDVLAGDSLTSIARRLNAQGVPTAQGLSRGRSGRWSASSVRAVLTNPRQAGMLVHRGEAVGEGSWEPIVDKATHERLLLLLNDPSRRLTKPRRRTLLTGLVRCANCGVAMTRDTTRGVRSLRCKPAPNRDACGHMNVAADRLEEHIESEVLKVLAAPKVSQEMRRSAKGGKNTATLTNAIAANDARLTQLGIDHDEGLITRAEWMERRTRIVEKIDTDRAELARLTGTEPLRALEGNPAEKWAGLGLDRQRAVLDALIEKVVVHPPPTRSNRFDTDRVDIVWKV